ncbi:putative phage abortive infection protein [Myroides sp. WP-1]|uniref:putative phage abortive infection protein n=1 Tax=Myroides sp. WP-1 TaxID=2759944 RepID=UPI0015FD1923|nr:hypothetical protein [Myroides sp. WP-1]
MKRIIKESFREIEFFKKSNWLNIANNPITNNLIIYLLLLIVVYVGFKTYTLSNNYFKDNELDDNISIKYNTSPLEVINNQTESYEINPIYDTVTTKQNVLIKDLNNPIKYKIEKSEKESFELGDIGDFIGGYFGYWLGLLGALLTFLAFYIQYKANGQVQKQFRMQQFESQLYKMIDVYLNNKDKFSIIGYKNPKNSSIDMLTIIKDNSFEKLLDLNKKIKLEQETQFIDYVTKDHIVFQKLLVELKVIYRVLLESFKESENIKEIELTEHVKYTLFGEAYKIMFWGLNKYCKDIDYNKDKLFEDETEQINNIPYKTNLTSFQNNTPNKYTFIIFLRSYNLIFNKIIDNIYRVKNNQKNNKNNIDTPILIDRSIIINSISKLKLIKKIHKKNGTKVFKNFYTNKENEYKNLWVKLNYTPFQGYLHFLPQYYRNLYSIVNFVVNQNKDLNLTKEQKLNYLRTLRSTMSEYEQTMLFYNWYSEFGLAWENQENHFFSEYKMIHNLKKITLIDDDIDVYTILNIPEEKRENFFEAFD